MEIVKHREERTILPSPSPGVLRRGSGVGLLRTASLRQRGEKVCNDFSRRARVRRSSLTEEEEDLEIMRHFVADEKKVLNRGDSIRRRGQSDREATQIMPSEAEGGEKGRRHLIQYF